MEKFGGQAEKNNRRGAEWSGYFPLLVCSAKRPEHFTRFGHVCLHSWQSCLARGALPWTPGAVILYSSVSRCTNQSHPWSTLSSSVVTKAKAPHGLGRPVRHVRAAHGRPQRRRGRAGGRHHGVASGEERPLELVGVARKSY